MQQLKVMVMRNVHRLFLLTGMMVLLTAVAHSSADGFSLTPGGVAYRDLQAGSGRVVVEGDVVTVHLLGWVREQGATERAFFNTRKEGRPVKFLVGTSWVMPGWNEGVQGMQPGGRRLLRMPPEMGIGARSFEDKIPANATLVFMVELLEVRPAAH
jgi:FKBP-type peptidyl-prolyl cis-trans isomerase